MLKFNHLTNLFIQELTTKKSDQSKAGKGAPFRPLFGNIDYQLKRHKLWNSLEVHVIYALFYLLCSNKKGYLELKMYLMAEDKDVFDPYFIAQYLLVPVNTIVNNYFLPWMMRPWEVLFKVEKPKTSIDHNGQRLEFFGIHITFETDKNC